MNTQPPQPRHEPTWEPHARHDLRWPLVQRSGVPPGRYLRCLARARERTLPTARGAHSLGSALATIRAQQSVTPPLGRTGTR